MIYIEYKARTTIAAARGTMATTTFWRAKRRSVTRTRVKLYNRPFGQASAGRAGPVEGVWNTKGRGNATPMRAGCAVKRRAYRSSPVWPRGAGCRDVRPPPPTGRKLGCNAARAQAPPRPLWATRPPVKCRAAVSAPFARATTAPGAYRPQPVRGGRPTRLFSPPPSPAEVAVGPPPICAGL